MCLLRGHNFVHVQERGQLWQKIQEVQAPGGSRARKKKKASAWRDETNPSFSLGFSDDEEDEQTPAENCPSSSAKFFSNAGIEKSSLPMSVPAEKTTQSHSVQTNTLATPENTPIPSVHENPESASQQDDPTSPVSLLKITDGASEPTNDTTPNIQPCSSTPAASLHEIQHTQNADMGISFVTPAAKGQSSKCISPATLTKCFSETELMNRMEAWDDKINLNCKSLEFDFTDSPVNKKKVSGGKLSKSPWSQGLSHPKRDDMLTRNFVNWLAACTSDELVRQWIMHAAPRYVELSGTDLKNMLCGRSSLSYSLFDVAIRRLNQLDKLMHSLKHLIHWRHILESDFAMLVFAGEKVTSNSSVRKQFMGELVLHQIETCRMITIPVLVRETWCAYFCDMKLKTIHVIDPIYTCTSCTPDVVLT